VVAGTAAYLILEAGYKTTVGGSARASSSSVNYGIDLILPSPPRSKP
jgi:hypothetical protein